MNRGLPKMTHTAKPEQGIDRRAFLGASAAVGLIGSSGPPAPARRPGVSAIGTVPRKLLFWDLAHFDYWDNIELRQGQGTYRAEATFEDPDRDQVIFPSVWREPSGSWRAVYGKKWNPFPICVLESDDGLRWQPRVAAEIVPAGGKLAAHHVYTLTRGSGSGIYHDPIAADGFRLKMFGRQDGEPVFQRALKDPGHVWHALANKEGSKRYMVEGVTLGSRDGVHWELLPGGTWTRSDWFPEDPVFAFYSPHLEKHVQIVRPGHGDRRVCWRETSDLRTWGDPQMLFQPDPLDDVQPIGFYTMPVIAYEDGYVGLLWVFHHSNSEPVRSFNQFYGSMDAQVTFSYDGRRFFRGKREPLLPLNAIPEHGCAQLRPCSVVVTENEIRIYSESHRYGHGREGRLRKLHEEPLNAMVLHTLRRDGFMFVRSRGDWARMLSKPFSLRSSEMTASVDARYGEARFQVTDLASKPIAGLTFDDCEPLCRLDEVEQPIRWKNGSLADHLHRPLRLEMKFYGANIFGLRADWQWLDAQGMFMLEDNKSIDHLLEL